MLCTLAYPIIDINEIANNKYAMQILSIVPNFAILFGFISEKYHGTKEPSVFNDVNFSLKDANLIMILDIIVFSLLYLYFEEVNK